MLSRARASCPPLLGVLLVVLVLGVFCGGGGSASASASVPASASSATASSSAPVAAGAAGVTAGVPGVSGVPAPGCGKGSPQDADHVPGTPARIGAPQELLPALYDAHAATGACGVGRPVLSMAPGRAPPALDPPSPIDLSVLRV